MEDALMQTTAAEHDQLRRCPNCNHKLTFKQIIEMMHGAGCDELVWVRTQDGTEALVEAGLVNPRAVEVLDIP